MKIMRFFFFFFHNYAFEKEELVSGRSQQNKRCSSASERSQDVSLCRASNQSQLGRGLLVDPEHAGGIRYTLAPQQLWLPLEELDRLYQGNKPSLKGRENAEIGSSSAGWWVDVLTFEKLPSRLCFILNCASRACSSDSRLSIKLTPPLELEVCWVYRSSRTEPLINLQLHLIHFSFAPVEILTISIIDKIAFFFLSKTTTPTPHKKSNFGQNHL